MGASAKVTTNAPAIPDTRVMMFPLLVLEMKERGERHKGSGGSAQNPRRCRHVTTENLPKLHARFFLMPRPASGRGRAKVWRIRGSDTARGPTHANRGFVGKNLQPYGGP